MRYLVGVLKGGRRIPAQHEAMNNLTTIAGTAGRIAGRIAASTHRTVRQIDWQQVWTTLRILAILAMVAAHLAWQHRATARRWAVAAIAAVILAAELTLQAGRRARQIVDAIADRASAVTQQLNDGPAAPLAPILGGLVALAEAGLAACRWALQVEITAAPAAEPTPAPAPAQPTLHELTVRELRRLAREAGLPRSLTRNGRRDQLLEALA